MTAAMQASVVIKRIIFGLAVVVASYAIARAESAIFNCPLGNQSRWRLEIDDRAEMVTRKVIRANGIPSLMTISPAKFSDDHVRWNESGRTLSIEFALNLRSGIVISKSADSRGGVMGGQIECKRDGKAATTESSILRRQIANN